jgi:hypothetical protein
MGVWISSTISRSMSSKICLLGSVHLSQYSFGSGDIVAIKKQLGKLHEMSDVMWGILQEMNSLKLFMKLEFQKQQPQLSV